MLRARIRAVQDENKSSQQQYGCGSRDTHDAADDGAVFPGTRVVVKAEEQHLIGDAADLVVRGLHQSETQVFWRKLHAVKILRDVTIGREHDDGGRVSVLSGLLVPLELETDGLGERIDRVGWTSQEMPALVCAGPAVAAHDVALFGGGHVGRFVGIETYGDYVEILADVERQDFKRSGEALQHFTTEHRALVVAEVQDDGASMAEVVAELYGVAEFVAEGEVGGDFGVQVLFDSHEFQSWQFLARGHAHGL